MIQLKKEGLDKESFCQALKARKVKKMVVPTSAITIYSLNPNTLPESKVWKFKRIDSNAEEKLNNNQRIAENSVSPDTLPTWARSLIIRTGFFFSVSTEDDELQFVVEKNPISTLTKFLNLQGTSFLKPSLARDLLLKSELDAQNRALSLIYRDETMTVYGENITNRNIVAFRGDKYDISSQLQNLKMAVKFLEKKGAVIDKWSQDQEKISVRMLLPEMAETVFRGKYGLPQQLVPCITLREGESGDAAFKMQAAAVYLTGTEESRKNARACKIGSLLSGKAKKTLKIDEQNLEDAWDEANRLFDSYASAMHDMQTVRVSPAGNAADNSRWKDRNMRHLQEFIFSAMTLCGFRTILGIKRRDEVEKRLLASINPERVYYASDIAMLFLKIPGWVHKNGCNETVFTNTADNVTRIAMTKEAA